MARFQSGQSGNPKGRPAGARNKLSEAFIHDLADDFEANGPAVIVRVRQEEPATYLRLVAALVPKQLDINPGDPVDGLSIDELQGLVDLVKAQFGEDGTDGPTVC